MGGMKRFLHIVLALIPFLLAPAWIFLLADGYLDFGGGEKDVLLTLPWVIWSVVFAICSFFLIYRRWAIGRWVVRSALISTAILVGVGAVAFFGGW